MQFKNVNRAAAKPDSSHAEPTIQYAVFTLWYKRLYEHTAAMDIPELHLSEH